MLENIWGMLSTFSDNYLYWISLDLPKFSIMDAIEIVIICALVYKILVWFKASRAWALLQGIIVVLVFCLLAAIFQMNTIIWIIGKAVNMALIALIVVFQPELRRALDSLGRRNFMTSLFGIDARKKKERFSDETGSEILRATFEMAKVKTGALIVIEQETSLDEYAATGIHLDSAVSSQLLINIFEKNTPLHDGAVIMRGDRVLSATCYLPLSDNRELSKELGTRHRAAVGISEVTDAMVIVVSEETGAVSLAVGGSLFRNLDSENLKRKLGFVQNNSLDTNRFKLWRKGEKNAAEAKKTGKK